MVAKLNYNRNLEHRNVGSSNGVGVRAGRGDGLGALSIGWHTFLRPQQSILRARDCPPGEDFNLASLRHCMRTVSAARAPAAPLDARASRTGCTRPERASLPRGVPLPSPRLR
ncbi:unnamed protein product, partial [Brenthis ino]